MNKRNIFELRHEGKVLFKGSENSCFFRLQSCQSHSAEWAMKYEGYQIVHVGQIEEFSKIYDILEFFGGYRYVPLYEPILVTESLYNEIRNTMPIFKMKALGVNWEYMEESVKNQDGYNYYWSFFKHNVFELEKGEVTKYVLFLSSPHQVKIFDHYAKPIQSFVLNNLNYKNG